MSRSITTDKANDEESLHVHVDLTKRSRLARALTFGGGVLLLAAGFWFALGSFLPGIYLDEPRLWLVIPGLMLIGLGVTQMIRIRKPLAVATRIEAATERAFNRADEWQKAVGFRRSLAGALAIGVGISFSDLFVEELALRNESPDIWAAVPAIIACMLWLTAGIVLLFGAPEKPVRGAPTAAE